MNILDLKRQLLAMCGPMAENAGTDGVKQVTTDSKVSTSVGRINEFMGYEHVANQYVKFF